MMNCDAHTFTHTEYHREREGVINAFRTKEGEWKRKINERTDNKIHADVLLWYTLIVY